MSPRKICITAVDDETAYLIAEILLMDPVFSKKINSVTALSLYPSSLACKELTRLGAKIVAHTPGKVREMVETLKETGCDALCLIPPVHKDKIDITVELIEAAKKANIPNICFLSTADFDVADPKKSSPYFASSSSLNYVFLPLTISLTQFPDNYLSLFGKSLPTLFPFECPNGFTARSLDRSQSMTPSTDQGFMQITSCCTRTTILKSRSCHCLLERANGLRLLRAPTLHELLHMFFLKGVRMASATSTVGKS
jgi:hypothetical protein